MQEIKAGNLTIRGTSIAGTCTSLHVPELKVVLDAGILHPAFAKEPYLFLSHCHLDHVGSMLGYVGVRDLKGFKDYTIFAPHQVARYVQALIDTSRKMDTTKVEAVVFGLQKGVTHNLSSRIAAKVISTYHPVPSNGYLFVSKKQKLKPEYADFEGREIAQLREQGVDITYTVENVDLAYCTDTTIEVLKNPEVLSADVLILECTFLGPDVDPESARRGGHIHIEDLIANADKFKNKHVVLMHFSTRYSNDEIRRAIDERLPAVLREKVQLILPNEE